MPTAVLVDAAFFLKRAKKLYPQKDHTSPEAIANLLHRYALLHLRDRKETRKLYRIYVYDCPPLTRKTLNPVSGKQIDFAKTDVSKFRFGFHDALKKKRLVALRLGHIQDSKAWKTSPDTLKKLISGNITVSDLNEQDVSPDFRQKGVDIKIGIDIASLAYKKLVDQIVLVSGDSDFVPAAKLARREGVDFILDPMWNPIMPDLFEHIDGLRTKCSAPHRRTPDNSSHLHA